MNKLIQKRLDAGLTQTALAIRAAVHPSVLNRLEQGVRPNRPTAMKLANALKCSLADLFDNADKLRRY